MAWSYSGDPSKSAKDQVRFLIGDVEDCDQLLRDEEINYLIDNEGSANAAASKAAQMVAAKFSRLADEKVGDISVSYSQKAKAYFALSSQLKQSSLLYAAMPFAGGISRSDKSARGADSDRVMPDFAKDMMENYPDGQGGASVMTIGGGDMALVGSINLAITSQQIVVTLPRNMKNIGYGLSVVMKNDVDTDPQIQPLEIIGKTLTTFTVAWNAPTDSSNYYVEWVVNEAATS